MKLVVVGAAALLLGLFLGGLGPRSELRQMRKELADAKQAAARGNGAAALPFALGMGALGAARERAQSVPRFVVPDGGARAEEGEEGRRRERRRLFGGDGGAEAFAAAKSAADVRAAQFRAAFFDEARLSPDKQNAFEQTVDQMNKDFAKEADEIAEMLRKKGEKVRPRDMADIGARLLEVYRRADDSFTAGLDEQARAARDRTEFDILTQVDVGAFRKLAETMETLGVSQLGRPR
jgi:hypothetical protein